MTQRRVSHVLLVLLAGLSVAFVVRSCADADERRGFIDLADGQDPDRLRSQSFRLERPVRLAIEATGSYETDTALAVYGWIVRRGDRSVVWQMTAENATPGRGTLATVADTIRLDAGTYDAYFTTFGDPLLPVQQADSPGEWLSGLLRFGNRPWESDESKWDFRLHVVDPADAAYAERLGRREVGEPSASPGVVWASEPAGRYENASYTFAVTEPATVRIDATGELYRGPTDFGRIENLATGERVWTMTTDNTEWAGGSVKNRRYRGTIRLDPGLYRATFTTDGSHDADRWTANPPFDPTAWGLHLATDTPDHVTAFDPWTELPTLVEMTNVGDDALETATFTLDDSLSVWVYALGEMRSRDAYDHAWLIKDDGGVVWEMDYDETRHAGGEKRNRVQEAGLALAPGTYTLHFETDDTHSPDRWHSDPPEHPERWGVTLFALGRDGDLRAPAPAVAVTRRSERTGRDVGPTPPRSPDGALPVRLAPLRNGEDVRRTFTLDDEARLRIYAVGEILRTERYDYGWITDDRADDLVWEMTRSNTEPAGGSRKNRRFDGTVTLPAGTYTVHFETDGSHAFGDFNQGSPEDPTAWGIVVERAAPAPPAPPLPPGVEAEVEQTIEDAAERARRRVNRAVREIGQETAEAAADSARRRSP